MNAYALFVLFMLVSAVAASRSCIIQEKKDEPEIHVIQLEDSKDSSSEPEVVALNIPEKRKREVWDSRAKVVCKHNNDCAPDEICVAYLKCVKVKRKNSNPIATTKSGATP